VIRARLIGAIGSGTYSHAPRVPKTVSQRARRSQRNTSRAAPASLHTLAHAALATRRRSKRTSGSRMMASIAAGSPFGPTASSACETFVARNLQLATHAEHVFGGCGVTNASIDL
jgi:hypothetical protein